MSQVNYKNLGCQIVAARGMAGLTRVELAKLAKLGHPVVKQAEDGDPKVSEDALVKICRALEGLGFEFSEGTAGIALAYHRSDRNDYGVTVDPSMPGLVRRIYPRQLGIRDLFKDLDTCGIVIENADRAMGLFLNQSEKSLPEYLVILVEEGRRFGIRFRWRTGVRNIEGVRYALATYYGFNENAVERVLHNIMDDNARAAVGARGRIRGATGGLSFKTASNPAPPGAAAESSRSVFRGYLAGAGFLSAFARTRAIRPTPHYGQYVVSSRPSSRRTVFTSSSIARCRSCRPSILYLMLISSGKYMIVLRFSARQSSMDLRTLLISPTLDAPIASFQTWF
jgi:hypothetical protein